MFRKRRIPKVKPEVKCLKTETEPIDLVITWVNGSDPSFKEEVSKWTGSKAGTETNRFFDMNQLKYLLRSVEKYTPWIRYIFLLTNGQIPVWMDTSYEKLKLVTHDQIFLEKVCFWLNYLVKIHHFLFRTICHHFHRLLSKLICIVFQA